MTEAEWLSCSDPHLMLSFMSNKASNRKLRLFACASCRRMWHFFTDDVSKHAIEISERYADGLANRHQLREAREANWNTAVIDRLGDSSGLLSTAKTSLMAAARATTGRKMRTWAMEVVHQIEGVVANGNPFKRRGAWKDQCNLLGDIFGNPFRPVAIDPRTLAWNDGIVTNLAKTIYDERAFDRLPILADALEEAGCTDADILNHCRQPGEHVRGCWVVDLLLGKS